MPPTLSLLLLVLAPGARAAPFYDNTVVELPTHGEEDRAGLAHEVGEILGGGGLVLVRGRSETQVETSELVGLPLEALVAIMYASDKRHRGGELDLRVPSAGGGRLPLSLWWEGARQVRLELGNPEPHLPPEPARVELRGLDMPLVEEGGTWAPREVASVRWALSRLEPRARQVLSGQPLVRKAGRTGSGGRGASHVVLGGRAWLEFYDDPFLADQHSFCGPPTAPVPTSAFVALHEVGHAIVAWPALSLAAELEQEAEVYERAYGSYSRQHDRLSGLIEAYNAAPSAAGRQEVEALQASVAATEAELQAQVAALEAKAAQVDRLQRHSPVLEAYARLDGSRPGPTPYSRESLEESLAESYALFLTDPAALLRIAPEAHAWLEAGGHLDAAGL